MADTVNLADEFAPPETVRAAVNLADEFQAPDRKDQYGVVNDAAEKARNFKNAFGPAGTLEKQKDAIVQMVDGLRSHMGDEQLKSLQADWEEVNKPLVNLPLAPKDVPDVPVSVAGTDIRLPILAGAYNGVAPVVSSLTSPLNLATLGTFGALTKVAAGTGPAAKVAQAGLTLIKGYFAGTMAKGAGEAAGRASVPEGKTTQEQSEDVSGAIVQSALAALAGHSIIEKAPVSVTDQSSVQEFNNKLDKIPVRPTTEEIPNANTQQSAAQEVRVGPEAETSGGQVAGGVAGEPIQPAGTPAPEAVQAPAQAEAPKVDYQYTVQRPQEHEGKTIPGYVQIDLVENGQNVRSTNLEDLKKEGVVLPPVPEDLPQGRYTLDEIKAAQPKLADEFVPPEKGTEENAAVQEVLDQQPPEPPAPEPLPTEAPKEGPTGIRNAIVDEERKARGLPPAMEEAARDFGTVWTDAMKRINEDPEVGKKLTDELVENPRAITDTEDAILTHRQVDLQNQFDKLTDRIVNGAEGQTPESLSADKLALAKLSDDLLDVYEADKGAGRETARGLNARKMLVNEDYSLAKMVTTRRAANEGRPLTDAQMAEVQALHDKIAATQKAFDEYRAKAEAAQKAQAGQKAIRKVVVTYIGERANEARARIKARMAEGRQMSGLDPTDLADYAIIGAEHLVRAADTGIDWAESMVKEFGERIKPHLEQIRSASEKVAEDAEVEQAFADRKKRLEARIKELTEKVKTGDTSAEPSAVKRPSVREIEQLEQQRDALSSQLADMRATEAKVKELEDAIAEKERKLAEQDLSAKGQPVNRPSPNEAVEKLKQERDQLNRDLAEARKEAAKPTDEEVTAKKLADMNERIAEKKAALASGDVAPERKPLNRPLPRELEEAKQELERLNKAIAEARPEPEKTVGEKVVTEGSRLKELERQIEAIEKQIKQETVFSKSAAKKPTSSEIKAREATLKELMERRKNIRESLQPRPEPATPEEIRLKAFKTRTQNRINEINKRLAAGDLGPRAKPSPIVLDPEATRLRAEAIRAQQAFQTAVIKDRLNNRSWAEKAQDTLIRWRRGFLLSGPATLLKLTGAAFLRGVTTPIEEVAGAGLGKVLPDVFNKAPRQGGFNSRAEAEAITSVWTKGIADAKQKLTTAKSDLDVLFGKGASGKVRESDVIPQSLIDFFGNLHGALKAPIMRSEFERSMVKRMDHAIREGVDVSDPLVQTKIAMDAYKDSQRAIFMQDNVLSKAFNTMVASLENSKVNDGRSAVGKTIATAARLVFPIVKVPTNIVAEAAEYAVGSITGSVEAAKAFKDGIKDLSPEQADKIARQLKKGSLGAAALLIGYYNRDKFGGLYQQGEKRKKEDLKPGEVQAGPMKVGRALTHSSLMEVMQIGATVGRIEDQKVKGKGTPLHEAVGEATLGLLEELPFVRTPIELGKLFDPKERAYTGGELVKGLVVPQAVSQAAQEMDRDAKGNPISRKPSTVLEHVETGIPGLRENVRKR